MASEILNEFEHYIDDFKLIPSRGGVFELHLGDTLVYSKKETGQHVEFAEVAPDLRKLLGRPDPASAAE